LSSFVIQKSSGYSAHHIIFKPKFQLLSSKNVSIGSVTTEIYDDTVGIEVISGAMQETGYQRISNTILETEGR
jgi:hypothetical protein